MKQLRIILPIPLIVICLSLLFLQRDYMDEYPKHIHAWAEQDHYALALGFVNNGFDLFHPETMIYNKQFPGWWKTASETTITAVDFPLHEYCVALLMRLFGTTSPWVFRMWTLIWSIIGLVFLYRVAFSLTKKFFKSLLVCFLALCSPVFAYYSNGFLPSIPAFALSVIGLWHYLRFLDSGTRRHFNFGIAFLTLAMLMRTTFAITLIAILCFELLRIIRKESTLPDKVPAVLVSAAAFLAYFLWNQHLREAYGTIFLNHLVPPENLQDAKELIADTYHKWTFHYFQRSQYYMLAFLILLASWCAFRDRRQTTEKQEKRPLPLWWFVAIYTFGCLLFAVAMMQQMPFHDYYLIDTFFLPVLLTAALLLKSIRINHLSIKFALIGAISVFCLTWLQGAKAKQEKRRKTEDAALLSYINFRDADQLLDSLDIPRDAKILCLYGFPQNGPFIQMGRKGFTVMEDDDALIEAALTWDFDYIVIENSMFAKYFEPRKDILTRLWRIGGNDKISVCILTEYTTCLEVWQFFDPQW